MKIITFMIFFFILTNCSLNQDSEFWTEKTNKENIKNNKLLNLKKNSDFTSMSLDEYKKYVEDYTKSSNYPDINK